MGGRERRRMSDALSKIGESFLHGMNLRATHVRSVPKVCLEVLKEKPIRWLRIHETPTRRLDEKADNGLSYLDGIEELCKAGYNLIVPIDVGSIENVGRIPLGSLDKFVKESYDYSKEAAFKLHSIALTHGCKIIFGVENEIDTKEWVLQSSPGVEWRAETTTWFALAIDVEKKYKRLDNILAGIHDAAPEALTMTNVEADDLDDYLVQMPKDLDESAGILLRYGLIAERKELGDHLDDWKIEMARVRDKLDVDLVGIDNYPNYIRKWPVLGGDIGPKVDDAGRISAKQVINCEFGYSTYRSTAEKLEAFLLGKPSAQEMQQEFFRTALASIEASSSKGTFPWVTFTEPSAFNNPPQEGWFGLYKLKDKEVAYAEPSFRLYCDWLNSGRLARTMGQVRRDRKP
jgi:hypothetical protein